jgi:hypothetical protein
MPEPQKQGNDPVANNDLQLTQLRAAVLKSLEPKKSNPQKPKAQEKPANKKSDPAPKTTPRIIQIPSQINNPKSDLKSSNLKLMKKITIVLLTILFLLIISWLLLLNFKWQNQLTSVLTKIIPYPVALIDYQPLSYYDWQRMNALLNNAYQKQKQNDANFSIPDQNLTQKYALKRIIEEKILDHLAVKYQVSVTDQEINDQANKLVSEIGNRQSFEKQINNLYNLNEAEFKQEIIKPLLLRKKLSLLVSYDDQLNAEVKKKAEEVLALVKKNPAGFEQLAKEYSQDTTAIQGGDLGYFSAGQLIPEFEQAAFKLRPGEISDLIKTQFGYHIIKVEEKLADEAGNNIQIRARHILFKTKRLNDYLAELIKQARFWQFIRL